MRVVGEDGMALQVRPNYGTSSEGVYGQGSAALLSETSHISNHSRALGGAAKLRRAAHAEVPSAKLDLVNIPINKTKTPPRLDNSDKVGSGGAGEKVPEKRFLERSKPVKNNPNLGPKKVKKPEPEKQILERSEPKKNNPNLGLKNVKKLELFPPRLIKKAKRQKNTPLSGMKTNFPSQNS